MTNLLTAPVMRWLSRLSFPRLFVVFALLFLVDVVLPDPIPFIDEILLGLGTVLFASWKNRKKPI